MKQASLPAIDPAVFRRCLVSQHAYRTPRAAAGRQPPRFPSFRYHWIVLRCVRQGARLARRGLYDRKAWEKSSATILLAVEKLGGSMFIEGLAPLARLDRPCIIAANHMSALETHALACILQPFGNFTFVVKRSLLHYPFFGIILQSLYPIAVSRSNPREDLKTLLREGPRRLADGTSLILFPQARRRMVFEIAEFNSIAAKLAGRTGAPLVPLALKTDFLSRGIPLAELGRVRPQREVRFSFGAPIQAQNREKEAHRETVAFITERLRTWDKAFAPIPDVAKACDI